MFFNSGAQKLGGFLAQQIKTLLSEMVAYNKQQLESGSSANQPTLAKGSILNRYSINYINGLKNTETKFNSCDANLANFIF